MKKELSLKAIEDMLTDIFSRPEIDTTNVFGNKVSIFHNEDTFSVMIKTGGTVMRTGIGGIKMFIDLVNEDGGDIGSSTLEVNGKIVDKETFLKVVYNN